MLILTRRIDETIIIDDRIKITVVEISRSQVKIGIEAPKDVSIFREEIYKQLREQ
ncbi:MAG: carbon storage regulator CsrA [Limnochordia bacterium]|jgi:carbon storage regulator|nr:carbon storage regulator CsrA [Limnochordia bacterium]MDD2630297.1 carbon storage regulator CsrA [Limnochordia bacterium]MDD4517704.1 carbon storage regulator CsrA [Limnochordia bacterium]